MNLASHYLLCSLCFPLFILNLMLASSSDRLSKVIILADDLSGAAELAGIAFTHGLSAEVQREFEPDTNANVVAIDTDSRHLAPSAAADRLLAIATKILATNPAWI